MNHQPASRGLAPEEAGFFIDFFGAGFNGLSG
jgi:hypothetical protein